jgi:threonylcarbamoyladenosine tRNA methylthiotransferase MtaB
MSAPVTVGFATLGCRLNQVESQELRGLLERQGFAVVDDGAPAEVFVVNTCTVTSRADFSDRQAIRRLHRANPGARLVVTGCYAQTDPEAVARLAGVDLVVGTQDRYRLPELIGGLVKRPRAELVVSPVADARGLPAAPFPRMAGRTRAFVKVQDGCQHRCAFCIVPAARGPSRSRAVETVVEQVRELVAAGHGEVTLTGVDIGHYGWDLAPRTSLAALLRAVVDVAGLRWARLSSVLPAYFTPELLDVVTGSGKVAPHLHLPLQSGSDRVLRLMRRPYNVRLYRALVERLASSIAGLGLGTDVIVGHPGEGAEDFAATRDLVAGLPFSYLHVFSYSDRKGTEAAGLGNRVPPRLIRARSAELRELAAAKSWAFRRGLVGQRREVVVLGRPRREPGLALGLTSNYVEVQFPAPRPPRGGFATLRIIEAAPHHTAGVLEEAPA